VGRLDGPKKFGRIINISSIEGKQANRPALSHYFVGRHSLNVLTKATARAYALQGITCDAILPGPVITEAM
jgi:3-hydroxybutyrate dehydrogenase/3-oxoacyl-[acyl-carrier protein] reductase